MVETNWVFLDGEFVPADAARISPFDRGYLFAQSAYEVTAVFAGKLIDIDAHLARFQHTLEGIEVLPPEYDLLALHHEIMARNQLQEGLIYLQASAGDQGPRDYYGPEKLTPSVFMFATHKTLIGDLARAGITAISYEDTRWARRDYKTTQLLTQTLAYRAARRAGAHTAILHEDGLVTEAASANLWIVTADNRLVTRDLSAALLPGITRGRLLSLLGEAGLQIEERAFTLEQLAQAKEAFTSSTGVVIAPVLSLDGRAIGGGQPGSVTRRVQAAYYEFIGADLRQLNWL